MLSPANHEFEHTSKAKVPFSWELEPGVSRRHNKSGDQLQWNLRTPPCRRVEYIEEVLRSPLIVCSFTPSNMIRTTRSNLSSFRKKEDDPFLEAYRKCLERSPIRVSSSMGRNVQADQDCYTTNKKKSSLFWLWSKYSCNVLFKNLGVDLKEVAPTSLLKDRKREIDLGVTHISQPHMIPEPKSISPREQVDLPLDVANSPNTDVPTKCVAPQRVYTNTLTEEEKVATLGLSDQLPWVSQLSTALANIGNHVVIHQELSGLSMHFPFHRVVALAMHRAIKEIVSSIVLRSVCIACQTTKELVLKDYGQEPDETRIYNAAHLMVASLAGSLAHVTCKEPLRTSIAGHLRNSLQGLTSTANEEIVQLVTDDNLDFGCAAIEQAATEKAIQTIDEEITQQLSLRRKNRDGTGFSYDDPDMLSQSCASYIPESLRPKPGHLSISTSELNLVESSDASRKETGTSMQLQTVAEAEFFFVGGIKIDYYNTK